MSTLYFRTGETEGFTSKKLADKKSGYANPIRELLQNSLDASKEAGNTKCEINIYIDNINKDDIPHIQDYESMLDLAIKFQKSVNSYNHNAQQIVKAIQQALKNDKLGVLMFVDNGKGMSPDILNGLIGERSVKSSEGSGGSFGVGHLSPYFLSSLRYVLYASKYKDNNKVETLFSGVPILAGFRDTEADRGATGRILKDIPKNESKPKFIFPTEYPKFIQDKMDEVNTGSMVAILGLNKKWDEGADYAIVSNFFYAINKQELKIEIDHNHNGIPISIDKNDIDRLLEKRQDNKAATNGKILSGSEVYQAWLAVKDDKNKSEIVLDGGDTVCVYIKNSIETGSVIALIRNGMLIARHDKMLSTHINNLRKDEGFKSFSVVINVDEDECPKLFELVKGAENPYHNKLEKNRLAKESEKKLKKIFEELSEKIKTFLSQNNRESFDLAMPLLEIPNKAEAQGSNTSRPRSQKPKATPNVNRSKPPTNKIKATSVGKKRQAPVIVSRYLESINLMRMKDKGGVIDVELNITPQKVESKDEVYLSISLAQDKDNDESGKALEFISLSIDGMDVEIPDFVEIEKNGVTENEMADKTQIKLGKLSEMQTYQVVATIEKPKNTQSIGVALKSFLGLKQGSE